jgi:hypothetical protein
MILNENNFHPDFFRLAIIGDFSKYKSKSLQDFIRESNKGNRIFFVKTLEKALNRLGN